MEGIRGVIKRKAGSSKQGISKQTNLPGIEAAEGAMRPNGRLRSEAHALAWEMCTYFSERNKFALYLGIIGRLGTARARAIFSGMKSESRNVMNPRKYFMWLVRGGEGVAKRVVTRSGGVSQMKLRLKKPSKGRRSGGSIIAKSTEIS